MECHFVDVGASSREVRCNAKLTAREIHKEKSEAPQFLK